MRNRVTILMSNELDGTLSDLERAELERKILLCPEARRDRAGWQRLIGTLKAEAVEQRRLPMERMAAEIVAQAAGRAPLIPFERMRRVVLTATLAAAGLAVTVLARAPEPRPPPAEPVAKIEVDDPAAPVELGLDQDGSDDDVAPITTIRF